MEKKKFNTVFIYGVVILLLAMGGLGCYIYNQALDSSRFAPGVQIGGISVQGKTLNEAVAAIDQVVAELNAASLTFYKDNYEYNNQLGNICLPVDSQQVVLAVWEQEKLRGWRAKISNFNGKQKIEYPLQLIYNPDVRNNLLQEWNVKWGTPPVNAVLDIDSRTGILTVTPGRPGMVVDAEATFKAMPTVIDDYQKLRLPIVLANRDPQVTEVVLSKMGQLSSFTTNYDMSLVNRSHNLAVAVADLDKSLVAPHATFSFNEAVGKCTAAKGYLDAMVIVGGKFEPGLAGGICQVSSTLYNAALLAGMDIIERRNHSLAVTYVPLGRDATVSSGTQDFKFMNNTDDPIYIRASVGGGRLTISIYGNLQYKKKIGLSNIVDQTFPFITLVEEDPNLKPGEERIDHNGQSGYVARAFRTFYNGDGTVIKTELLSRDTYQPLNKLVYHGPDTGPVTIPDTTPPPVVVDPVPDPNAPNTPNTPNDPNDSNDPVNPSGQEQPGQTRS
ncbi:MAG: VanW family protein [Syntrophomonadaceae bacterium]|nr:VanW family protein [Syntrophomonadaceae bacterium]